MQQEDSGDSLDGTVNPTLYGVKAGASMGKAYLIMGSNTVAEEGAFRNGAGLGEQGGRNAVEDYLTGCGRPLVHIVD